MNTRGRVVTVAAAALLAAGAMALLRAPAKETTPAEAPLAPAEGQGEGPREDAPAREPERASSAPVVPGPADPVDVVPSGWAAVDSEDSASLVRPLISAIRGEFPSDQARRAAMLDALHASGTTDEAWTALASSTFSGFRHGMRDVGGVTVDAVRARCFRAGCEATVVFEDEGTYRAAASAFRELNDEDTQLGGRVQTPAVRRADGRFEGSWIVLRPG